MQGSDLSLLSNWQNFYMIIGTAAATLTGLMFVVTTLIAGIETHRDILNAGLWAFNTPTIVHFCAVLLTAGILSAPWQAISSVSLVLIVLGLLMVLYLVIITQRMRHIPHYTTSLHDWMWYMVFPLIAYIGLIVAAIVLTPNPALGLYIISSAIVTLLFLAIHNAWDLVTYLAVERSHPAPESRNGESVREARNRSPKTRASK